MLIPRCSAVRRAIAAVLKRDQKRAMRNEMELIRNWFAKRPHWRTHFTPTSSSWINQVERFFALLAEKQIKRGAHTSVKELIAAIEAFISQQNANPKPLRWTKSAEDILATIERFCRRTLDVHPRTG
jgi:transposase